jgi:hypothetical protein
MNSFANIPEFPSADFKAVARPNFDTLYSIAWLDFTKEPMIVSVPDTGGRYYLMPMLDMWTDAFAAPGWRTTGTQAADFLATPPGCGPISAKNSSKNSSSRRRPSASRRRRLLCGSSGAPKPMARHRFVPQSSPTISSEW